MELTYEHFDGLEAKEIREQLKSITDEELAKVLRSDAMILLAVNHLAKNEALARMLKRL